MHFTRNLLSRVPRSHQHMAAAVLKTIFAQPDAAAVHQTWDQVAEQLAGRFPRTGEVMADAKAEVLAFVGFPKAHWQKIWSTNSLERINKEIKRRSRVEGITGSTVQGSIYRPCGFPNQAAAVRLVGAILADTHDEWQATGRRYLSEHSMTQLRQSPDTITNAELTTGNRHRGPTQNPTT